MKILTNNIKDDGRNHGNFGIFHIQLYKGKLLDQNTAILGFDKI